MMSDDVSVKRHDLVTYDDISQHILSFNSAEEGLITIAVLYP